jgi:hypothetical protein
MSHAFGLCRVGLSSITIVCFNLQIKLVQKKLFYFKTLLHIQTLYVQGVYFVVTVVFR